MFSGFTFVGLTAGAGVRKLAFTALMLASIITIAALSRDAYLELRDLRQAPKDNVQWTILQVQAEYARLRLAHALMDPTKSDSVSNFVDRFDIFYSRIELLKTGSIFDGVRSKPFFADGLKEFNAFLSEITPIIDAGVDKIQATSELIDDRLRAYEAPVQKFVTQAIAEFASSSDTKRQQLSDLFYSLALVGVLFCLLLLQSIFSLRRHARNLETSSRELRDSEERMAAAVQSALDAVIVADAEGVITEFNDEAVNCFGFEREQALGMPLADLIVPKGMREAHRAGMRRFLETGEKKIIGKRIEINALNASGYEFPVELAVGTAHKEGAPIFVAFARDISERRRQQNELEKAREAAEAADEAKSRFLAVMSHEMRTPLNGVLGILELLQDTELSPEQVTMLTTASNSGELLLDLINDVLDLSKMEAGKLHLDSAEFNFAAIPESIYEMVRVYAEERNNRIILATDPAIPASLHCDEKRLTQIILNLVSNANKFTKNGTINVNSQLKSQEGDEITLRVEVIDTGIGIPPNKLPRLFDEFMTVDNTYKRRQGGTGLGLAICQHLVSLMGGQIGAESTFGEGSRFWFEVRLPKGGATGLEQVGDKPTGENQTGLDQVTAKILLAEDNPTNAMVASSMLRNAGHDVTVVHDGGEAIKAARSDGYDLILMDISMPELDGVEATRLIRSMPTPIGDVPIIAMTAHALPAERQQFLEAGMQSHLTKPVRRQTMLETIRKVLQDRQNDDLHVRELDDPLTEKPLLDETELRQLSEEIGDDHVAVVLQRYVTDTSERAATINEAMQKHDLDQMKKAAHALAGSSSTVGAFKLFEICKSLETACKIEGADGIASNVAELLGVAADTLVTYQDYLSVNSPSQEDPSGPVLDRNIA